VGKEAGWVNSKPLKTYRQTEILIGAFLNLVWIFCFVFGMKL